MHLGDRARALQCFYEPFYVTQRGHIVGLATTKENMRDGLPIAEVARLFPSYEFPEIVLEPGRRAVQPGQNLIVVGWASLLMDPAAYEAAGREPPASVDREKFARIVKLYERSCYRIQGRRRRYVENRVTKRRYHPVLPDRKGRGGTASGKNHKNRKTTETDFGVIRRWFRGPTENTVLIEGVHRLGTIGAAKIATDWVYLAAFLDALGKLGGFRSSVPLEILVSATFDHEEEAIYSLDRVRARPIAMVYNGEWVYSFENEDEHELEWVDQLPWDVHIGAAADRAPLPVPPRHRDHVPRLELRADLRDHQGELPQLCRELLSPDALEHGHPDERVTTLIESLVAASGDFSVEIWDTTPHGEKLRAESLPDRVGRRHDLRQRFLVHLAMCRLLGSSLQVSAEVVRRCYPEFRPELKAETREEADRELVSKFIGQIPGKWRESLKPLLGKDKNYVVREFDNTTRSYRLTLKRAMLVLKLRF